MADQNLKSADANRSAVESAFAETSKEPGVRAGALEIPIPGRESLEFPEEAVDIQSEAPAEAVYPRAEPIIPASVAVVRPATPAKDPALQRIENILGEDLTDTFLGMTPERQKLFKEKGEATASLIQKILDGTKINTKKIFDLIRQWLKLIPGVNRFFLEQEAKIKTDKILSTRP